MVVRRAISILLLLFFFNLLTKIYIAQCQKVVAFDLLICVPQASLIAENVCHTEIFNKTPPLHDIVHHYKLDGFSEKCQSVMSKSWQIYFRMLFK